MADSLTPMTGLRKWLVTESGLLTSCGFARTAANYTKQMYTYFLQSRVQWGSSHHTVQLFSCPFHSSLPSLEQHLLLFSYRIMFKYKLGTEDLDRHCYSLVWRFLPVPIIIMITIIMTMYLTCCERDVKHVSLSIIFFLFFFT